MDSQQCVHVLPWHERPFVEMQVFIGEDPIERMAALLKKYMLQPGKGRTIDGYVDFRAGRSCADSFTQNELACDLRLAVVQKGAKRFILWSGHEHFRGEVFSYIRTGVIDFFRRRKRERRDVVSFSEMGEWFANGGKDGMSSAEAEERALQALLDDNNTERELNPREVLLEKEAFAAVLGWYKSELTEEERVVLILHEIEGMTMEEGGSALGKSDSSFNRIHKRALGKLVKRAVQHGFVKGVPTRK